MFERYTQRARRVIFHAREEVMRDGSPYIESEHLLLGVLRENGIVPTLLGGATQAVSEFRRKIERIRPVGQPVTGPVEVHSQCRLKTYPHPCGRGSWNVGLQQDLPSALPPRHAQSREIDCR